VVFLLATRLVLVAGGTVNGKRDFMEGIGV
jgi:hypothetical protein